MYLNVWQIRYVRVIQKIYPDKKGDPTSLKFPKQWLESCDEAEKECIYQASYKGYLTVMKWAPILTFVALILHMFLIRDPCHRDAVSDLAGNIGDIL